MMTALGPLAAWLQTTGMATAVGESTLLSGLLSGMHLIGLTLLVGGALVSMLRLLGLIFPDRPVSDITAATDRGMMLGLAISIATGFLLLAPRASQFIGNSSFQTKMLVLLSAGLFHFAVRRRVIRRSDAGPGALGLAGACGFALWFGVALAGCALILLE